MRVLSRSYRLRFLATGLAMAANATAFAIPVIDQGSGLLVGAQGILVGGTTYDVEFLKGSCGDIFSGCDDPSDFAFNDLGTATLASQALLDHVFLDSGSQVFDSLPAMTAGCHLDGRGRGAKCLVQTPFTRVMFDELGFRLINLENTGPDHWDMDNITSRPAGDVLTASLDNSAIANVTWARWSRSPASVPEPSTLALLALAMAAVLGTRRSSPAAATPVRQGAQSNLRSGQIEARTLLQTGSPRNPPPTGKLPRWTTIASLPSMKQRMPWPRFARAWYSTMCRRCRTTFAK